MRTYDDRSILEKLADAETIERLCDSEYGEVAETLLLHWRECFTSTGRLNKSALARALKWRIRDVENALRELRRSFQ